MSETKVKLVLHKEPDEKVYEIGLRPYGNGFAVFAHDERSVTQVVTFINSNLKIDLPENNLGFVPGTRDGRRLVKEPSWTKTEKLVKVRKVVEAYISLTNLDLSSQLICNDILRIIDG